jgi:hypothetical protein
MLFSEQSLASSENWLTGWNKVMWTTGTRRTRQLLANNKRCRRDLDDGKHKQGKISVTGSNRGKENG